MSGAYAPTHPTMTAYTWYCFHKESVSLRESIMQNFSTADSGIKYLQPSLLFFVLLLFLFIWEGGPLNILTIRSEL